MVTIVATVKKSRWNLLGFHCDSSGCNSGNVMDAPTERCRWLSAPGRRHATLPRTVGLLCAGPFCRYWLHSPRYWLQVDRAIWPGVNTEYWPLRTIPVIPINLPCRLFCVGINPRSRSARGEEANVWVSKLSQASAITDEVHYSLPLWRCITLCYRANLPIHYQCPHLHCNRRESQWSAIRNLVYPSLGRYDMEILVQHYRGRLAVADARRTNFLSITPSIPISIAPKMSPISSHHDWNVGRKRYFTYEIPPTRMQVSLTQSFDFSW